MWSGDCVDPKSSGEEDGSITPPLPVRSPAPPAIPPAFLRSHSLGKNEIPGKSKSQPYHNHHHHHQDSSISEPASVALNLLGRHTHGYPNQVRFEAGNSEITKANFEELQAKCAQMEKTMRWWSECTANWRDKWSKVRAERNKYKDDLKRLSIKHEATLQDLNKLHQTEAGSHKVRNYFPGGRECKTYRVQGVQTQFDQKSHRDIGTNANLIDMTVTSHLPPINIDEHSKHRHFGEVKEDELPNEDCGDSGVFPVKDSNSNSNLSPKLDRINRFLNDVSAIQNADQTNMLQFRLDEAIKTLEAERQDKDLLQREIEALHTQICSLELKCDELTLSRSDLTRDLQSLRVDFTDQIRDYARQVDDNASNKNNLEQVIGHLREEIERLQAENAEEWGRRERLETEKSSMHRIIKKLKGQTEELKERLEKVSNHNTMQTSTEMAKLHNDLDKQKIEIADLKHANTKFKKNIHDKNEELTHWQRKCDNNDKEVRALRNRIEHLKQELGEAQDDLDNSATSIRKLERSNEEFSSQCEGLQVQVEHLTSRLRSVSSDWTFRKLSRVSAPGGILASGFSNLQDVDTSTDENEFQYEDELNEVVNETDV